MGIEAQNSNNLDTCQPVEFKFLHDAEKKRRGIIREPLYTNCQKQKFYKQYTSNALQYLEV